VVAVWIVATLALLPLSGALAGPVGSIAASVTAQAGLPTPIQHVVVIFLENRIASNVFKYGPFEAYLAEHYAYADHYYGVCHPSAPNYLAVTSGETLQCGSDNYNVYSAENLGTLLTGAGRTWAGFAESMPYACDPHDAYPYEAKHNPFLFYSDIVNNSAYCAAHDLPLTSWYGDVANGTVPNFAFIEPNMTDSGHDGTLPYADNWLRGFLGPQLNASWMQSSAVFVTYDEGIANGQDDTSGYNGTVGGHVFFTAVSPFVRGNSTYTPYASHYNLLSTVEWLMGVGSTGHNDSSAFPAMKGLFNLSAPGNGGGLPLPGPLGGMPPWSQYALVGGIILIVGAIAAWVIVRRAAPAGSPVPVRPREP
jgi:hypothetical protein